MLLASRCIYLYSRHVNGKLAEERGVLIISRLKEANTDAKILVIANNDAIDYIRQNTVNYMT